MANSIDRLINIFVKNDAANASLENTDKLLSKVDNSTTKVTKSVENHSKVVDKNKKSILENGGAVGLLAAATGGLSNDFKDAIEVADGFGIS